jgi:ATP-binding cassette, subfamily B, bacterial
MMRVYGLARELVSEVNTDLQENVAGVRIVQSFVREELSQARFDARSAAYRAARLQAQRWIAVYFPLFELICDLALVAVLAAGARDVAAGTLSPGVLTAFLLYLQLFFAPLQTLSALFDGYQQARVGLRRISGLLRIPAEPPAASLAPGEPPAEVGDALRGDIQPADPRATARAVRPAAHHRARRPPAGHRRPRGPDRRPGRRARRGTGDA